MAADERPAGPSSTHEMLADIVARLDRIEGLIARRSRGPRDGDDRRVVRAVAAAIDALMECGELTEPHFLAADVFEHRKHNQALAEALELADCDSVKGLGGLFARVADRTIDGVRISAVGEVRGSILWRVERV